MASVASQLIEEVTAHAPSDSREDAREICADGSYFPNSLRIHIPSFKDKIRRQSDGSMTTTVYGSPSINCFLHLYSTVTTTDNKTRANKEIITKLRFPLHNYLSQINESFTF